MRSAASLTVPASTLHLGWSRRYLTSSAMLIAATPGDLFLRTAQSIWCSLMYWTHQPAVSALFHRHTDCHQERIRIGQLIFYIDLSLRTHDHQRG